MNEVNLAKSARMSAGWRDGSWGLGEGADGAGGWRTEEIEPLARPPCHPAHPIPHPPTPQLPVGLNQMIPEPKIISHN